MLYNSITYIVFKGLKMIYIFKNNLFKINNLLFYHLFYTCKLLINNVIFCKYFLYFLINRKMIILFYSCKNIVFSINFAYFIKILHTFLHTGRKIEYVKFRFFSFYCLKFTNNNNICII